MSGVFAGAIILAGPPAVPAQSLSPADKPSTTTVAANPEPFDPRTIVSAGWALEYAMIVQGASTAGASAAQVGLDRLAAADYPAAIAAFQASLADPAQKDLEASTAFLLGWAYHGAKDDRQALAAWRRAASADPTIVAVHLAIAEAYLRLSQPALAIQALREGLRSLPGSPELLDKLGRLEERR